MSDPAVNSSSPNAALTMEAFFTRERANEGIEFPLDYPDGRPSPFRLKIRGVDSDAFKAAKADSRRRLLEIAQRNNKVEIDAIDADAEHVRLISTLVVGWTFPQPFTPDAVFKFLKEAPQIVEQIDRISARRGLFMPKDLKDSISSLNTKSD